MSPLIEAARTAQANSYAPYSGYRIGAAIETASGDIFRGCNIENANFSNSLHAEEVALANALVRGYTSFSRIAVSSHRRDGVTPCGMCRQTLAEFCDAKFGVVCDHGTETTEYTLGDLLPNVMRFEPSPNEE